MPSRFALSVIVFIASSIFVCLLVIDGVAVEISWLRFLSPVVTILILLLSAFNLFLWKIFPEWLIKRPKIYGTWRGTIQSNWPDRDTGEQISPIECYVVIHQTFFQLSCRQMTAESSSRVINGGFVSNWDNVYQIYGIYCNEPELILRAS